MDAVAYALASGIPATSSSLSYVVGAAAIPGGGKYWQGQSLLDDGTVLLTGGGSGTSTAYVEAQIWDPDLDTWTQKANLLTGVSYQTQTTLSDGRVILCNGLQSNGVRIKKVQIYDPDANSWAYATDSPVTTYGSAACLLANGTLLLSGGSGGARGSWIWDPTLDTWTTKASMNYETSSSPGMIAIPGNKVLNSKQVTEMYDVALNTWTTKSTNAVMAKNTLWNLADGRVGNVDRNDTAYAYDITLNTWSFLYGFNNPATQAAACTILSDGSIFITSVSTASRLYPEETGATPGRAALLGYLAAT